MQNSSVGAHIREHREKAGLTQMQLAEVVFATRQTVGNWERGGNLAGHSESAASGGRFWRDGG